MSWVVAGFVSVALVGVTACKKEDKAPDKAETKADKPDDKSKDTTPEKADPGGQKAVQKISPSAGGDDLSLLPVDSEVVMGLNLSQLQQSSLWKQFVEPVMMKGDIQAKLAEFKTKCGFDPLSAVKTISIGMKGIGNSKPDGVIVVHGVEKTKAMSCFEKMKAEAQKDAVVTVDGDVTTIKSKGGDTVAFSFVNDTTALMVIGANANKDGIKAAAAGGSALRTSPKFVEMYSKINTQDSLWMLMNGKSKAFDKAATMGFKLQAVYGSINVTDGLTLDFRMRVESPDQATTVANTFKSQAAGAASMFDKLDITNDGSDVKLAIALSNAKLQALIKQFAPMLGGMGGMGGGGMGGMGGP